jgi:hypothetical protein
MGTLAVLLICCGRMAQSQSENLDSMMHEVLTQDSLMIEELLARSDGDTPGIFDLLDSLLAIQPVSSQLSLRLGYTSNITYAGRNFGINQHGLSVGAGYYHSSGLYTDISGYWNSDLEPRYNPTIATLGFLHSLTPKWHYNISYDHYFFNQPAASDDFPDDYNPFPLTNAVALSSFYELWNFFSVGIDYSYMFGAKSAHRIRGDGTFTLDWSNVGFIDRLAIMPGFSLLLGDDDILYLNAAHPERYTDVAREVRQIMIAEYGALYIAQLWRQDKSAYRTLFEKTYAENEEAFVDYTIESQSAFGLMNYSVSVPVYMYVGRFTLAVSYFLNIPVALPGEQIETTPNSYISTTLIYNIPFK